MKFRSPRTPATSGSTPTEVPEDFRSTAKAQHETAWEGCGESLSSSVPSLRVVELCTIEKPQPAERAGYRAFEI
jgi:hypothetical protein